MDQALPVNGMTAVPDIETADAGPMNIAVHPDTFIVLKTRQGTNRFTELHFSYSQQGH
jgi:hypothetical protein